MTIDGDLISVMNRDRNAECRIAEGLKSGDSQAWLNLYDCYAEKLWKNVARWMPGDATAVADIVQESLLAAARSARSYDSQRGSLWIWLWTITKRQMALHYRKKYTADRLHQAWAWWRTLDGEKSRMIRHLQTPPQMLENKELGALVRHCLSQLPADYQIVLMAKYVDDVPVEQLADHLNRSTAALRSILARARKAFRKGFVKLTKCDPVIREVIK